MPPEQASGETDLDQRADIYSLAASVYHALLGQTMHHGRSSTIIMYKQVTESADLEPLRQVGVGDGLIKLMSRMLEKNRKRRYNTWDEVLKGIKQLAPGLIKIQETALSEAMGSAAYPLPSPLSPPAPPASSSSQSAVAPSSRARNDSSQQVLVHPTVRLKQSHSRRAFVIMITGCVLSLLAGSAWWVSNQGNTGLRVTPATFAVILASAAQQNQTLELEPGDYPGPWRFGIAHAGVTLRASAPGVRVINTGLANDVPLVRCEPGLSDFTIIGVELRHEQGLALEAMAGAKATFEHGIIAGQVRLNGAHITLNHMLVAGSIVVDLQGAVVVNDSAVSALPAINLQDGRANVSRSRLLAAHAHAGAIVLGKNGILACDAVEIIGFPASSDASVATIGLELEAGTIATLRDVAIRQVMIGVQARNAQMPALNGLSVSASQVGLQWSGERLASWQWERIQIKAATPVNGISLEVGADGARPERLGLIPAP
jgi:hypothetical protein